MKGSGGKREVGGKKGVKVQIEEGNSNFTHVKVNWYKKRTEKKSFGSSIENISCSSHFKLGRNLLHEGGKGERKRGKEGREVGGKKGVKVQIEEGNSNFTHVKVNWYKKSFGSSIENISCSSHFSQPFFEPVTLLLVPVPENLDSTVCHRTGYAPLAPHKFYMCTSS